MDILSYTAKRVGKATIFSCSDGRELTTDSWSDAITYLLEPCYYAVVYHIDKFAEAFYLLLPKSKQTELISSDRTVLDNGEKIFYSGNRQLSLNYGWRNNQRNEVSFYGLSRYSSDKEITDAKELYELWREVVKAYDYFGIIPTTLASPVGAYEPLLDSLDFTRACDLPASADDLINKCADVAWEEWRATYKLGLWQADEVSDLDVSSSYPSQIAKLPDLSNAKFFTSKTMPDKYSWGLIEGTLNITKDVTPFLNIGKFPKIITTGQLRQLRQYNWGEFEMDNGWFINIPKGYRTPFSDIMAQFYKAKQGDNKLVKKIAKAISVGIGGKFNSRYDDNIGKNYNPIYAKMITSACQCQVADMIWCKNLQDKTISITVDGVLVEGKPAIDNNNGMGSWRVEPASPFLVLSQLFQWGNEKHPDGHLISEILDIIKANPDDSVYGDIDLNILDYDRVFGKLPKTGGELISQKYYSKPNEIKESK